MNKVPTVKKVKLDESKYSIKCPHYRNPRGVVVHNTYNDAPAANEVAYMQRRTDKVSFHAAIDDKEVVEGLPLNVVVMLQEMEKMAMETANTYNLKFVTH